MAAPLWFAEAAMRKRCCVAVKITVGEGVYVESPLPSVLHGPTGLPFAFARVLFLGSSFIRREATTSQLFTLGVTTLCSPSGEAEVPHVPTGPNRERRGYS